MKKLMIMAAMVATVSVVGLAAPVACPTFVPNVMAITGSQTYTCGSLTFSNFSVSPNTETIGIGTSSGVIGGNDVALDFMISGITTATADTFLFYQVNGPISGVDLGFQAPNSTTGNVHIFETACKVAFDPTFRTCVGAGNTLANFDLVSNGNPVSNIVTFAQQSQIFIKKDIQFNGDTLSDFANTHLTGVPEPMTLSLVGAGLLGLGLAGRRFRKS